MTLILVEVPNEAAVEQLRQQPGVRVVGVIVEDSDAPAPTGRSTPATPSSASLIGTLSDESAEQMRAETTQMRNEWKREA